MLGSRFWGWEDQQGVSPYLTGDAPPALSDQDLNIDRLFGADSEFPMKFGRKMHETLAFIDQATSEVPSLESLIGYAVAFCIIAIVQQGLTLLSAFISQKVAWLSTNRLRSELLRHCLIRLEPGVQREHPPCVRPDADEPIRP